MSTYFDELRALLREGGVPAGQAEATIADLAAYVAESGSDPEEEFGPAGDFAGQLLAAHAPEAGSADGGEWRWTADIFADRQALARFGDQGWEIERVDHLGRFVSRRDPERPQRWEYRRELVAPGAGRALEARLAPEGWEPCGTWLCYRYFKRPKAASVGPAAQLYSPPAAPARSVFFSRRFYLLTTVFLLALVVLGVLLPTSGGDKASFIAGMAVGACTAVAVVAASWFWAARRRG